MSILQHVKIKYDLSRHGDIINEIFNNRIARTIWLGVRPGHLVSDSFDKICLRKAKLIEEILSSEKTITAEDLLKVLSNFGGNPDSGLISDNEIDFATELLPYILSEKEITYEIDLSE